MADETRLHATAFQLRTAEPAATPENSPGLPSFTDDYRASGTVDGECSRLVLVMGKDGFKPGGKAYIALQYVHLGTGEFGFTPSGQSFSFLFSDLQPKRLTVEGRNLLRIFDYVSLRRMPWLRVIDRDFQEVGKVSEEPVITAMRLEKWEAENTE